MKFMVFPWEKNIKIYRIVILQKNNLIFGTGWNFNRERDFIVFLWEKIIKPHDIGVYY